MEEEQKPVEEKPIEVHKRLEITGYQETLGGELQPLTQFKNLKEKQELKAKILNMMGGEMIRSIITPRTIDRNMRSNKLERQHERRGDNESIIDRADKFGKKDISTISTFPSPITYAYVLLLSKEGDRVFDSFMGHNSRAEDVLSLGRKYYAYDVHKFPIEFTQKAIERFNKEDYELALGSSENCRYLDEFFDFSITCPPYYDIEDYNKIYDEKVHEDLSSKDDKGFLRTYAKCLRETFRVLKREAYFVIVVGDRHRAGKYDSLMLDTIKLAKIIGFRLHDINIYNRMSNIGGDMNYKMFILKCRRFPTIHEFILVFQKPER